MVSAKSMSSGAVSNYHKKESYHKEVDGEWGGKLADKLNLHGKIKDKDFKEIIGKDKKNAGSDFTFSMPKSASIAMYLSPELKKIIMQSHEKSVNSALKYIEDNLLEYRTKKDGIIKAHDTDKMLYSKFDHMFSRDLDPQTHTHVFIHNRVYGENGKKYALDARKLYRNKHLLGHLYRNEMNKLLQEKGIKTIVTDEKNGFYEIDGITKEQRDKFSKRRNTIVAEVKKRGWNIKNLRVTSQISLETRKIKAKKNEVGMERIIRNWRENFAKAGIKLENLKKIKGFKKLDTEGINKLFNDKTYEIFQKSLGISEIHYKKHLLKAGLKYGVTIDDVDKYIKIKSKELIQGTVKYQKYYTSFEAYDLEKRILEKIEGGKNNAIELSEKTKQVFINTADKLGFSKGQESAFLNIVKTKDMYSAIQGYAGVGKTYMLDFVRRTYEHDGWKVRGMAFQGKAAKELSKGAKIDSSTIHSFLKNYKETIIEKKELWVVDESSTIDNSLLHKLQVKVEEGNGKIKVVFVGDKKQLQPIGIGNAFTQALEGKSFQNVSYMEEILRQKSDILRNAVYEVLKGNTKKAMELLDKNIHEHSDRNTRHDKIVDKYLELKQTKKDTLIITGFNADRIDINERAHKKLFKRRFGKSFEIDDNKSLRKIKINNGEKIIFLQNNKWLNVKNGTLATIKSIEKNLITVEDNDSKEIISFNPKKYNHFDYGYCVTTHKSQGATVDRTILNINTEQKNINSLNKLYVDLSRAKYGVDIFVNKKSEIADSFQKWQEKLSIKDFGVDEKTLYEKLGVEKVKLTDVDVLNREVAVFGNEEHWFELRMKNNKNYYTGKYNYDGTFDIYKDYIPKDCPFSQVEYKMRLNKLSEKEKTTMLKKDIESLSMSKINKINERPDMKAIFNENKMLQKRYNNIDLTHKQLKIVDKYAPEEIKNKLKNIGVTREVKEWLDTSIPKYKDIEGSFHKDIKKTNEILENKQSFKMSV